MARRSRLTLRCTSQWRGCRGFALVELITTLVLVGVAVSIAAPRFQASPARQVRTAARQLLYDLDAARTSALASKRGVLMAFDDKKELYVRYMDADGNGTIAKSPQEMYAMRGRGEIELPSSVTFGRGSAGPIPGDPSGEPITFDKAEVEFDSRGLTVPFGTRGVVYLVNQKDPQAVAAVSISGSASLKLWVYRDGGWQ